MWRNANLVLVADAINRDDSGTQLKNKTLVAVTWNDAHGNALGEFAAHEIPHAPYVWTTIGFLLRRDDQGVSLASELGAEGNYRGVNFIPQGMILSVKELLKPRVKRPLAPKAPVSPASGASQE